jgi:anti-anti-sigma factor
MLAMEGSPTRDGQPNAPSTGFEASGESIDGASVVTAKGELDMATAPQIEEALIAAEQENGTGVVLDLSGVEFIDSSALRVLILSTERLNARGDDLHVVCQEGPIRRLFELTVLTTTFQMHADRGEAIAAASSAAKR